MSGRYLAEIQLSENLGGQKNQKILRKSPLNEVLAMHITNQKLRFDIFTVQNIFIEHDINILMIFGIILTQCIVGYCYKYTCVTYDCFCAPESYLIKQVLLYFNI